MSNLLFNRNPLVVNTVLAEIIGLNESIVLQQIHYWLDINQKAGKNFCEGKFWTYNTVDEWQNQFKFWSYETVKRTLQKLRRLNLLITSNFNKADFDRTLWYTINYEAVEALEKSIAQEETSPTIQNEQKTPPKTPEKPSKMPSKPVNSDWVNLTQPIPETNTEIIYPSIKEKGEDRLMDKPEYSIEFLREKYDTEIMEKEDPMFREITELIYDVVNAPKSKLKINGADLSNEFVKSRLLKLNHFHLQYVIDAFRAQTHKIKNIRSYLLTALYNSLLVDLHYENANKQC